MASYYRRKNGTYCIRVSRGKPGGKQDLVSTTYKPPKGISASAAERGAKEFAELFEASVHNGLFTPGRKQKIEQINPFGLTLADFIQKHYYKRIEVKLSPTTVQFYKSVADQFLIPSFGRVRVCDISSAHLQSFVDYLASAGSRCNEENSEPLSGATVKRYATVFSSVMTEAHKMGYAEKDILHRQAIDYPRIVKPQIQAYDDDEARIFFNGLKEESPQIRALLMTSLLLGLRRGEVVGLMWSDINFKTGSMYISRSAYKTKGQPQALKPPKSQSSVRTVFFSEAYAEVLLAWREEQVEQRIKASRSWNEQGFVFTNEFGNMINICLPTEICSRFEEKCGLRHLKLHGLRHTCGSLMIKNGVDIETVKSVFGHENIRTTQQYLTAYDSAKKRAADALAACIMN